MIDQTAHDAAEKALASGIFDWQAYLVLCASEARLASRGERIAEPKGFDADFREYAESSGPARLVLLENVLDDVTAVLSELLAMTDGDENESVRRCCARISSML